MTYTDFTDTGSAQSSAHRAAVWSFRKGWNQRFGQSGVRQHVKHCVAIMRQERDA